VKCSIRGFVEAEKDKTLTILRHWSFNYYIILQALYQNDKFNETQMHNYRMAVTGTVFFMDYSFFIFDVYSKFLRDNLFKNVKQFLEREVRNGCIDLDNNYVKDHVIIYTRYD
jgi:hypothetical protein